MAIHSKYARLILAGIFSVLATFGANYLIGLRAESSLFFSNGIMALLFFAMLWYVFDSILKKGFERREVIVCVILGLLFSGMLVIGTQLYITGYPYFPGHFMFSSRMTYAAIIMLAPFFATCCLGLFKLFDGLAKNAGASSGTSVLNKGGYKGFLVVWLIIFLLWIPALLLLFPGIFGRDSAVQISQFLGTATITSHHPIAHSLLMSGLVALGNSIFGSLEAGLCVYSVFQMLVMSAIFAYTCKTVAYIRPLPRSFSVLMIAFFGIFPVNQLFAIAATKDVLFGGFALLYCCFLTRIVLQILRNEASDKRLYVGAVISLLLAFLFRNNGLYAFVLTVPFLLIIFRRYLKLVLPLILVTVIIGLAFNPLLMALTGARAGSSNEMLSVPAQQISRVAVKYKDELPAEDLDKISIIIPDWETYDARIADHVKENMDIRAIDGSLGSFFRLYFDLGKRYPNEYLYQFLDMTLGSWYPDMVFRDPGAYHPYILFDASYGYGDEEPESKPNRLWIYTQSFFPELHEQIAEYVYGCGWQETPVLSMLFSPGCMFWILLVTMGFLIAKRRYKLFTILLFPFAIWFTFLLGPVVQVRYLYILFLVLPLELGLVTMPPPRHSSSR